MAFENYQFMSWIIYLLSALGVLLVTLRITRRWPRALRGFVMTTATVLFMLPWYIHDASGIMAPAVIITFFESFGGVEGTNWMRAGVPLLAGLLVGYLVLLIYLWLSRKAELKTPESDSETSAAN